MLSHIFLNHCESEIMLELIYPENYTQEIKSLLNDVVSNVNAGKQSAIVLPMTVTLKEVKDAI